MIFSLWCFTKAFRFPHTCHGCHIPSLSFPFVISLGIINKALYLSRSSILCKGLLSMLVVAILFLTVHLDRILLESYACATILEFLCTWNCLVFHSGYLSCLNVVETINIILHVIEKSSFYKIFNVAFAETSKGFLAQLVIFAWCWEDEYGPMYQTCLRISCPLVLCACLISLTNLASGNLCAWWSFYYSNMSSFHEL